MEPKQVLQRYPDALVAGDVETIRTNQRYRLRVHLSQKI
jgi:hypothetical protein